jgi:hypothetical protein
MLMFNRLIGVALYVGDVVKRGAVKALKVARNNVANCLTGGAVLFAGAGVASATDPASCTSLASTPTLPLAVQCLSDTVAIGSFAVTVLTLFVPLLAMIWGLKGGFGIIKRLVGSMFGSIRRGA